VYSFLAVGGDIHQDQNLEAGETILVEKVPFERVLEHMRTPGAMYQSMYIATMFYVINYIRTTSDPALQPLKQLI
jgi:hypothetical protein